MGFFSIPLVAPLLARLGLIDPTIRLSLKAFERPEPSASRPAGPSARRNAASIRIYAANVLPRLAKPTRGGTTVPVQAIAPRNDIFIPPVTQGDPHPDIATYEVREVPGGHWAPTYNPKEVGDLVAGWIAQHEEVHR